MATVSALLTSKISILPNPLSLTTTKPLNNLKVPNNSSSSSLGMVIECSSRPQKKATTHHRKTRPKKSAPWDIRRGPAVYPPFPQMPFEWSFVIEENVVVEGEESGRTKEATVVEMV